MFKKPVKLTLTVMPTQTAPSAGELSDADIVFDGKTFTVTFMQTAGMYNINLYPYCVAMYVMIIF